MLRFLLYVSVIATGTMSVSGATITAFRTYTAFGTIPTSPLSPTFSGSTANLSNATVSCVYSKGCNGIAFAFTLSASGYDPTQILSASLGGNLSGTAPASGTVSLSGNFSVPSTFAFSIPAGDFDTHLFSTTEPVTGLFGDISFFSLTLAPGQVLTLASGLNLSFSDSISSGVGAPQPSSVPEPGFVGLVAAGLTFFMVTAPSARLRNRPLERF